ncbi:MAG TPA: polysaccharide deacetylase family protein, partial [Candidatus Nitrosotalea sp.]|nr:polysaccharide deacetylase family protein [Candidatus Nitrosotalea sp.]
FPSPGRLPEMNSKEASWMSSFRRTLRGWRGGAPLLVLNFHRVGLLNPSDPFRHLDTISQAGFQRTLAMARFLFQIVRLSDGVERSPRGRRARLVLTFDDVSRTFLTDALPVIEKYRLPVTLFPCVRITETGRGWRDLVYFLMDTPDLFPAVLNRVGQIFGEAAVRRLQEQGLYKWTKNLDHRTSQIETEILLPALGERRREFDELVLRHQPYLKWADLKKLAGHPLVTIGSHGVNHYDYRGLSSEEIRRDVSEAQEQISVKLGIRPEHFALPFGEPDQRVWQTLDNALPALGMKTASWCAPYANGVNRGGSRIRHVSRLNARSRAIRTLRDGMKAFSKPLNNWISLFPNARLAGEGRFDTEVSEDEYRHIHRLLMPDKRHHQLPEFYAYLFKNNPYRDPLRPVHLGLHYEDNLEAIFSLFWVQFSVCGKPTKGAYGTGWWRLPQIHSQVGTKPFLEMARAVSPVLGAYKASVDSGRLFARDGWQPVRVNRYEGRLTKIDARTDYEISESFPAAITALLDAANASASLSVWRDRRYYAWRFEGYPLLKYAYLFDAKPARSWFALVTSDGERLSVSDFLTSQPSNDAVLQEMLASLSHYLRAIKLGNLAIETNNATLQRVCEKSGLKLKSTYDNFYHLSGEILAQPDGARLFESGLHETQATGDVLPT